MTDKRIKSFLEDRLKRLESIRNEREWTTAELGDIACCKQALAFIDSLPNEPVSEDVEEAATNYATHLDENWSNVKDGYIAENEKEAFIAGAQWQITKLMKDATDVTVHIDAGGYPYILQMELYDYDKDIPLAKEGDKYKVILIKEE